MREAIKKLRGMGAQRLVVLIASVLGVIFFGGYAVVFGDPTGISILAVMFFGGYAIYTWNNEK